MLALATIFSFLILHAARGHDVIQQHDMSVPGWYDRADPLSTKAASGDDSDRRVDFSVRAAPRGRANKKKPPPPRAPPPPPPRPRPPPPRRTRRNPPPRAAASVAPQRPPPATCVVTPNDVMGPFYQARHQHAGCRWGLAPACLGLHLASSCKYMRHACGAPRSSQAGLLQGRGLLQERRCICLCQGALLPRPPSTRTYVVVPGACTYGRGGAHALGGGVCVPKACGVWCRWR